MNQTEIEFLRNKIVSRVRKVLKGENVVLPMCPFLEVSHAVIEVFQEEFKNGGVFKFDQMIIGKVYYARIHGWVGKRFFKIKGDGTLLHRIDDLWCESSLPYNVLREFSFYEAVGDNRMELGYGS